MLVRKRVTTQHYRFSIHPCIDLTTPPGWIWGGGGTKLSVRDDLVLGNKLILAALAAAAMSGQTQVDLKTQSKSIDFSLAPETRPIKTNTLAYLPATCAVGDLYFVTNAPPGANIYGCVSLNTWALQSGGGSSGGSLTIDSNSTLVGTRGVWRSEYDLRYRHTDQSSTGRGFRVRGDPGAITGRHGSVVELHQRQRDGVCMRAQWKRIVRVHRSAALRLEAGCKLRGDADDEHFHAGG